MYLLLMYTILRPHISCLRGLIVIHPLCPVAKGNVPVLAVAAETAPPCTASWCWAMVAVQIVGRRLILRFRFVLRFRNDMGESHSQYSVAPGWSVNISVRMYGMWAEKTLCPSFSLHLPPGQWDVRAEYATLLEWFFGIYLRHMISSMSLYPPLGTYLLARNFFKKIIGGRGTRQKSVLPSLLGTLFPQIVWGQRVGNPLSPKRRPYQ